MSNLAANVSPVGDGWRAHATFLRQAYSASTSASTTAGQTPSFGDTHSVISYSSDGSERWSEGAVGSRSTAMRELRERIQRERQQLQDLENQLAHRKPIPTQSQPTKVPLAAQDSSGTRRLSPSRVSPDVVTERHEINSSVDRMSSSVGDAQKSTISVRDWHRETPKSNPNIANGVRVRKLSPPADSYNRKTRENLFPSQGAPYSLVSFDEPRPSSLALIQDMLISLESDHGMFRGTIASVKDSVSKLEVAQEKEKGKQRLALGQVDKLYERQSETEQVVQELKAQVLRVEEEHRIHASKIFQLDRALDSCRIDTGELKQQILSLQQSLQRLDTGYRVTSADCPAQTAAAYNLSQSEGTAEIFVASGREITSGETEDLTPKSALGKLHVFPCSFVNDSKSGARRVTQVPEAHTSPAVLILAVPLALLFLNNNRAVLGEFVAQYMR